MTVGIESVRNADVVLVTVRLLSMFTHFHSHEVFAFLSNGQVQLTGVWILGMVIVCFCACAVLRHTASVDAKQIAIVEVFEKRSKPSVKQDFGEYNHSSYADP